MWTYSRGHKAVQSTFHSLEVQKGGERGRERKEQAEVGRESKSECVRNTEDREKIVKL